jgi:hypothetical protein
MSDGVDIRLTQDEALVLFEWLSARSETVRSANKPFDADEIVLARVQATLEKTLVEPFAPNYAELLAEARRRIVNS